MFYSKSLKIFFKLLDSFDLSFMSACRAIRILILESFFNFDVNDFNF